MEVTSFTLRKPRFSPKFGYTCIMVLRIKTTSIIRPLCMVLIVVIFLTACFLASAVMFVYTPYCLQAFEVARDSQSSGKEYHQICPHIYNVNHSLTVGSPAIPRCPFSISFSSVSFSDFISWNELASCCFSIIIF